MAFWIILIIGITFSVIHTSHSHNKNEKKETKVIVSTVICDVVITITLAIVSNFIYDHIKDENTNSNTNKNNSTIVMGSEYNSTTQQENSNNNENASNTLLYQRLKDKVTEEILCFVSDDFDDDGKKEAFAIVGKEQEDVWIGCPFFINEKTITKLSSDAMLKLEWDQIAYRQTFRKVFFGKQKAIVFSLWANNFYRDEAYGIINGEPMQYSIPDVEGGFKVTENFITLTVDAFDGCCFENLDWEGGHTWKPYYFFWNDGLNSFSEYGGIEITLEQLSKIKDVLKLMNQYSEDDYSLINIIYRANKIININFRKKVSESVYSHVNVTLYIQNDSIYLSDEEILEKNAGYYLTAITPKIAVYPEFPY